MFQDGIQKYFKTYLIPIFNPCFRETKFNLGFEYEIDNSHFKILFNLRQTLLIFRKLDKIQFQFHFKYLYFIQMANMKKREGMINRIFPVIFMLPAFAAMAWLLLHLN